eukprot:1159494-Pelagomonas_calceolata.AAC.6
MKGLLEESVFAAAKAWLQSLDIPSPAMCRGPPNQKQKQPSAAANVLPINPGAHASSSLT